MKAVLLTKTSENNLTGLFEVADIPTPGIKPNQVLIRLSHASLNHRDLYIAQGKYSKIKLPVVPCSDGAGVIMKKGNNVNEFSEGEEVVFNPGIEWGSDENFQSKDFRILGMPDSGTLSEYIAVDKLRVYRKPFHLEQLQAAAIPLCGVTAYRALYKKADLKKGDNILITGIGGGVSSMALAFAVSSGANVFVTSGNEDKIRRAIDSGAKGGVNYKNENWDKELLELSENKIDVILDSSGGDTFSKAVEVCSYGGRIVTYGATNAGAKNLNLHRLYWKQLKIYGSTMGSDNDFAGMINFVNENKIQPVLDEVFTPDRVVEAFERMEKSEQFGKIIVSIKF